MFKAGSLYMSKTCILRETIENIIFILNIKREIENICKYNLMTKVWLSDELVH